MQYLRIELNSNSKREAGFLLRSLLSMRLIAGGSISEQVAVYRWKSKVRQSKTYNIVAFSTSTKQKAIISWVKEHHSDETPIIVFQKIDAANKDLLAWIKQNVSKL